MRGKHPTKAAACCNGEKLFFIERWIAVVPAKDVQVEINHFIKLFGVKNRKEGIEEAVQAIRYVIVEKYDIRIIKNLKKKLSGMLATILYSISKKKSRSFP